MDIRSTSQRPILLVLALLAVTAAAYAPGLNGPFLFDDWANLAGLAAVRADPSWYSVTQYALSGHSSELGRPLSLLSFAAQAASWDQHPGAFIAVNVALHLLNGALWYGLLTLLQKAGALPRSRWLPLGATALWLLMPMHAVTVLYVVQRMAILATTCFLAGTLLYVRGRLRAPGGAPSGYLLMGAGVFVGTLLGTLCKETAAVTPLMILALEATLLRHLPRPRGWSLAAAAFLWLPGGLLVGYLALHLPDFIAGYANRSFSLTERLLTESRVLYLYLAEALAPSTGGARAFYDDLPLSTSLWRPWTTAIAVAGWAALALAALHWRRRAPVLALAVAWYLLGNLLESTVVPLEIAFSHRAYLPLLGVALAISVGLDTLFSLPAVGRLRNVILGASGLYLLVLLAGLLRATSLWAQPLAQAHAWLQHQPDSPRALLTYGSALLAHQDLDTTYRLYRAAWERSPDDAVLALSVFELGCFHPEIDPPAVAVHGALQKYHGPEATVAVGVIDSLVSRFERGACPHQTPREVAQLVDTMLASPGFAPKQPGLRYARAMLLEQAGDTAGALAEVEHAIALDPRVPLLQQAALWSVQLGDVDRARSHLRTAEESSRISDHQRWLHRREIAGIRQLIELYESLPGQPPA